VGSSRRGARRPSCTLMCWRSWHPRSGATPCGGPIRPCSRTRRRSARRSSGRSWCWPRGERDAHAGPARRGRRRGPRRGRARLLRESGAARGRGGHPGGGDVGVRGVGGFGFGGIPLRVGGCGAGRGGVLRRLEGDLTACGLPGGGYDPAVGPRREQEGLAGYDGQEGSGDLRRRMPVVVGGDGGWPGSRSGS
jgi:hypothetical protein